MDLLTTMKKHLLTGVAALFLTTGTAHAEQVQQWPSPNFVGDCRRDQLRVFVDENPYPLAQIVEPSDGERRHVVIENFDKATRARLEKELRRMHKCDAYYQCLEDRNAGKVKHCYVNDPRWRGIGVDGL